MHIRLWGLTLPLLAGLLCGCNHFPTPFSGAPGLDPILVVTQPTGQVLGALPGGYVPLDCQRAINWESTVISGSSSLIGNVAIEKEPANPQPEIVFERYRNNCISIYLAAIDLSYEQYKRDSIALVGNLTAGADFTQTALAAASAAVGSNGTKTLLAGIAAAIGTAKTQISSDVLYNTLILAAFAQMDADRNSQHGVILQREQNGSGTTRVAPPAAPGNPSPKPMPAYTMYEAANDLLIYYEDGTFAHAVVSL